MLADSRAEEVELQREKWSYERQNLKNKENTDDLRRQIDLEVHMLKQYQELKTLGFSHDVMKRTVPSLKKLFDAMEEDESGN